MANELLQAIENATAEDLEQINHEILTVEKKLASLKTLAKVLSTALHGEGPKKKFTRNPALLEKYRKDAATLLLNGPRRPAEIADECGIPKTRIAGVLECPWFAKTDQGVQITVEGRRSVG